MPSEVLAGNIIGGEEIAESTAPLAKLMRIAKQYASMHTRVSEMPVHTVVENRKIASELADNYFRPSDPNGRLQQFQLIDWDK